MDLKFNPVTRNAVHVLAITFVVVEIKLGRTVIIEFKDKVERGACSAVETLVTVLIWDVLVASLLPGASINKIRI